ncbi:HAD family hydrolase [Candidatus Micrarchaeota archaeon]|nr:HAD family hydrolase [Candidatus Micrarchaeota archaeon]MBI5176778.1 HAD family hydrolase [Candidatus Micrarchaeota archaeon]
MFEALIIDFNRTLYDPDCKALEEGAAETLKSLRERCRLGLLSKSGEGNRAEMFEELGIRRYFDVVVIVGEKGADSFRECAARLCAKPENVLAVGDQVKKDIRLAKSAGCKTAWFKKGKFAGVEPESADETPDYTTTDLKSLVSIVGK